MNQIKNIYIRIILQLVFILSICMFSEVHGQGYEDAPTILRWQVENDVQAVLAAIHAREMGEPDPSTNIIRNWKSLLLYTVMDAYRFHDPLSPSIHDIERIKNVYEAARTDKNVVASPNANGTTTIVEKAGLPRLIAFAVESGAVKESVNGTNLTLATTPYALLTLLTEDTQQNYTTYSYLNRIGVSATFHLDEASNISEQNTTNNLKELNLRVRLLGDRSTRSEAFNIKWVDKVKPLIQQSINNISGLLSNVFGGEKDFNEKTDIIMNDIQSYVEIYITQNGTKADEVKKRELVDTILGYLKSRIYDPIRNRELNLSDTTINKIPDALPTLRESQDLFADAQSHTNILVTELNNTPLLTFGYTLQKFDNRTDISVFKLIYDQPIVGNSLYANAFLSLNHNPDETINEKNIHDFGGALSWERKFENIITRNFNNRDISYITIALDMRLGYMKQKDDVVFSSQLRFEIPILGGLVLPGSLRYNSSSAIDNKSEFVATFGMTFDVDKLIALSQL